MAGEEDAQVKPHEHGAARQNARFLIKSELLVDERGRTLEAFDALTERAVVVHQPGSKGRQSWVPDGVEEGLGEYIVEPLPFGVSLAAVQKAINRPLQADEAVATLGALLAALERVPTDTQGRFNARLLWIDASSLVLLGARLFGVAERPREALSETELRAAAELVGGILDPSLTRREDVSDAVRAGDARRLLRELERCAGRPFRRPDDTDVATSRFALAESSSASERRPALEVLPMSGRASWPELQAVRTVVDDAPERTPVIDKARSASVKAPRPASATVPRPPVPSERSASMQAPRPASVQAPRPPSPPSGQVPRASGQPPRAPAPRAPSGQSARPVVMPTPAVTEVGAAEAVANSEPVQDAAQVRKAADATPSVVVDQSVTNRQTWHNITVEREHAAQAMWSGETNPGQKSGTLRLLIGAFVLGIVLIASALAFAVIKRARLKAEHEERLQERVRQIQDSDAQ